MYFSFTFVTGERVMIEVRNLNPSKARQDSYIPTKITKDGKNIFSYFLYHNINNFLHISVFPPDLKKPNIVSIHEKTPENRYRKLSPDQCSSHSL